MVKSVCRIVEKRNRCRDQEGRYRERVKSQTLRNPGRSISSSEPPQSAHNYSELLSSRQCAKRLIELQFRMMHCLNVLSNAVPVVFECFTIRRGDSMLVGGPLVKKQILERREKFVLLGRCVCRYAHRSLLKRGHRRSEVGRRCLRTQGELYTIRSLWAFAISCPRVLTCSLL